MGLEYVDDLSNDEVGQEQLVGFGSEGGGAYRR